MLRKVVAGGAFGLALVAVAGALATTASSGSKPKRRTYTIGFVADSTLNPRDQAIARGGRAASKALGVKYVVSGPRYGGPPPGLIRAVRSLIARHVDAILTGGFIPELKPILKKARAAGIVVVAQDDDTAARRSVWVNGSSPAGYAQALSDALASQLKSHGEYAIVRQPGQFPIADEWQSLVAKYVAKTYPNMHLDGSVEGSSPIGEPEPSSVQDFMAAHPNLKGFIAVVPRAAYAVAEAITEARKIGKVFSAGNGGGSFGEQLPGFVRGGAAEFVYASNPIRIGYLSVWATKYLLTGHRFRPGAYQVGGRIGIVWYHAAHQELRLGQPLTMTKANVDRYANKF